MAKDHIKDRNWSFEEDVALCLAWISISEDGALGTNQNKKVLWAKIVDKFNENSNTSQREVGSFYDRWKVITKACTLWKGSLERVVVDMVSGRSAIEVGDKAMAIYKTRTMPKNQAFKLHHAWDVHKDCLRWGTDVDQQWRKLFGSEAASTNVGTELVDSVTPTTSFARLPGKDKQKEAKRKWKMQEPVSATISSGFAKLTESHNSRGEEAVRMHLAFEKQVEMEQERFDSDIMREDPNKYTPNRRKYFNDMQKEIMQKKATRSMFQDDDSSQAYIPSPPQNPPPSQGGDYYYDH